MLMLIDTNMDGGPARNQILHTMDRRINLMAGMHVQKRFHRRRLCNVSGMRAWFAPSRKAPVRCTRDTSWRA